MPDFTLAEVRSLLQTGAKIERADLRGTDLTKLVFDGKSFIRCDFEGAIFEGAKLTRCNFKNTSLREAFMAGADLSHSNFDNADLEGANLERSILLGVNLSRANLEGAKLAGANLSGARLAHAQLEAASLGGADLSGALLSHADLSECDLSSAKLSFADLSGANLRGANLEEADLSDANMAFAEFSEVRARGAKFARASLHKAKLRSATLVRCDLSYADLRDADLSQAELTGATLTGARVSGLVCVGTSTANVSADWLDASSEGDGSRRITAGKVAFALGGEGPIAASESSTNRRFFGRGDVLRNAMLEFEAGAFVLIESLFEECSISLGQGAELVVGRAGVLSHCQIKGAGNIIIHGHFFERESPGIVGARQVVVTAEGALVGAVEQAAESTTFAFEPGCKLRMKILEAKTHGDGQQGEAK